MLDLIFHILAFVSFILLSSTYSALIIAFSSLKLLGVTCFGMALVCIPYLLECSGLSSSCEAGGMALVRIPYFLECFSRLCSCFHSRACDAAFLFSLS